ncbi:helix-turn-helix transcriptional regulator [Dyadobacter sandarakinus]|uniref:Plasmid maintenance system antidote protein n=1 Tax=Dyadobacter sandarakinus TaxID=2747268 RepID=A0ABX7I8N9_9BACT|nr:plasmid maintenance system antidote protein [Dyadobacter sandarakinus]QRR02476.1 plasmid maintenance system antidote protein [Dyadobacter sandarakinus]
MEKQFEKYRGIHPGIVLDRELKKRSIKQRPFALSIAEHPQSFNAILKGKRNLNTALALRIEKGLDLEEGTLVLLQAYYDIHKEKEKLGRKTPNLAVLRKSLFWDTNISQIDWEKQANAVIKRVCERGDDEEKQELTRFYGQEKVQSVLQNS